MGWYDTTGWGGWLVMALMMFGFWALVGLVAVSLVRGGRSSAAVPGPQTLSDDAVQILDARFARGEIEAADYESRRAALLAGRAR